MAKRRCDGSKRHAKHYIYVYIMMNTDHSDVAPSPPQQPQPTAYVIAVIAKCPMAGQSKTRLQPLFSTSEERGADDVPPPDPAGAVILAKAMLWDVLVSISHCCRQARQDNRTKKQNSEIHIDQLLFYAPPTNEGYTMMQHMVDACHDNSSGSNDGGFRNDDWTLLPMDHSPPYHSSIPNAPTNREYDSHSSNLSNILSNVVRTGQNRNTTMPTTVILFGMDAPEIPMSELYTIITTPFSASSTTTSTSPSITTSAFLCPAHDGGYVMLSIPPLIPPPTMDAIFQSVVPYWSHPRTALAQIKAFSDVGIATILGPLVHDIDTPDDVLALVQRLKSHDTTISAMNTDSFHEMARCSLHRPSVLLATTATSTSPSPTSLFHDFVPCQHTRQALMDLRLL